MISNGLTINAGALKPSITTWKQAGNWEFYRLLSGRDLTGFLCDNVFGRFGRRPGIWSPRRNWGRTYQAREPLYLQAERGNDHFRAEENGCRDAFDIFQTKRERLYAHMVVRLSKAVVPVRPDRSSDRLKNTNLWNSQATLRDVEPP